MPVLPQTAIHYDGTVPNETTLLKAVVWVPSLSLSQNKIRFSHSDSFPGRGDVLYHIAPSFFDIGLKSSGIELSFPDIAPPFS